MRISMSNCGVPQTLFVINGAAVSLKIINARLTVFLNIMFTFQVQGANQIRRKTVHKQKSSKHTPACPPVCGDTS
jgi:hypothetical protein